MRVEVKEIVGVQEPVRERVAVTVRDGDTEGVRVEEGVSVDEGVADADADTDTEHVFDGVTVDVGVVVTVLLAVI